MTTIRDVVTRARRAAWGSRREPFNRLSSDITDSDTTLTLNRELGHLLPETYIGVDGEIMFVTTTDLSTQTATVERGDDTPAVAHSAGARVEVGWRWFTADMLDYLVDEVRSWGDQLFVVEQVEVSVAIRERAVDLPLTRFRYPLALRRKFRTVSVNNWTQTWADVPGRKFRVETNMPTAEFPSGNALIVGHHADRADYRLDYAQALDLTNLRDLGTDISTIGVDDRWVDIAVYGTSSRALNLGEIDRSNTTTQPEPRQAAEVASGDRIRTALAHKAFRDERFDEEARRLKQLYRPRL